MTFEHKIVVLKVGDKLELSEGDMMSGSHLAADSEVPGAFNVVVHVLRLVQEPFGALAKEQTQ